MENFLKEYKASLKLVEVEEIIELFFYRPLAFLFVKAVYKTKLTPNQVTFIGLIFGLSGGVALSFGTKNSTILASFFYFFFSILDCADGQLARLKENGTQFGRIFDGMADYIVSATMYIAIGIGFSEIFLNPYLFWSLVLLTAISNIFHAISVDYYRNRFIDYTQSRKNVLEDELESLRNEYNQYNGQKNKLVEKIILKIYLKYATIQKSMVGGRVYDIDPNLYYNKNKKIIHFWTYLGPATQWFFLIICLLFNVIDIYLWSLVTIFNLYAIIIYMIQKQIDNKLFV